MTIFNKSRLESPIVESYRYYLILFSLLISFLIGETLIERYLLGFELNIFQHMIPASILYSFLFLLTLWWGKRTGVVSSEMGFHRSYLLKSIAVGLLATSGYLLAVAAFQISLQYSSLWEIFAFLLFTLLIGLTEETSFRGYILTQFSKGYSQFKAILFTGILFALLHIPSYLISGQFLNLISVPSLILVGLILGLLRIHSGNIWGVIIAHSTWDFYLFLFAPDLSPDSSLMALIPILVASSAMWGTLLLSVLVAKKWIDRPTQIPLELAHEYQIKIQSLLNHLFKLQRLLAGGQAYYFSPTSLQTKYSEKVQLEEKYIEIYKTYLPLLNEKTYKIIQELVPKKLKLVKIQTYFSRGGSSLYLEQLQRKKSKLEQEIQVLESQLKSIQGYNLKEVGNL
ncbi:MAG: lysostaphin resistance A-like protein [Candidatus Helarchaeota archaeon]